MSFINVRQPLTRQPTQAVEVDPQFGASVVLTGDLRRNLARSLPVSIDITGLTFGRGTPRGLGVAFSGAATGGGFIATVPSDAPALTSIFVASIAGSGGGGLGRLFNQATGHDLFYNAGGSFLAYQVSYSTTAAQWQFSQATSADLRCFVFSCNGPSGAAPLFYVDGNKRTHFNAQTPSGTRTVGGATYGVGRVTSGTGRFHNGTIALAAFLPYAASEGLVQELSYNPWQLFRQQRRVFYSIPSDTTDVSLSATEAADTASVAVRVNASLAATEAPDRASATVAVNTSLAATESSDTAAFAFEQAGSISLEASEGPDSASLALASEERSRGGKSKRYKRRYVVEVDGQDFAVESEADALALLQAAKETAQEVVEQSIADVTERASDVPTLKVPRIRVRGEVGPELQSLIAEVSQVRADIRALYERARRDAEIAYLMQLEDEEEALTLLL